MNPAGLRLTEADAARGRLDLEDYLLSAPSQNSLRDSTALHLCILLRQADRLQKLLCLLKDPVAALCKHCNFFGSVLEIAILATHLDTSFLSACLSASAAAPQATPLFLHFKPVRWAAKSAVSDLAWAVLHRRTEALSLLASAATSARLPKAALASVGRLQPELGVNQFWSVLYSLALQPEKLSARTCEERDICSTCTLSQCLAVLMQHLPLTNVHAYTPLVLLSATGQHPISVFGFAAAHGNVPMLRILLAAPGAAAALQELGRPVQATLQCEYSPQAFLKTQLTLPHGSRLPPQTVDQALRRLRRWQCLKLLSKARCSAEGGEEMQAVLCGLEEAARLLADGPHASELAAVQRFLTQSVHACAHCGYYGRWAACAHCQSVFYCSRECQLKACQVHKLACSRAGANTAACSPPASCTTNP